MAKVQKSTDSSSLAEVVDRILDKGIVIDAWVKVSLVGIELLSIRGEGRWIASVGNVSEVRRGNWFDGNCRFTGLVYVQEINVETGGRSAHGKDAKLVLCKRGKIYFSGPRLTRGQAFSSVCVG